MINEKSNWAACFIPPRPKFSSVSLYDEPFLSYGPNFRKSALNDPKWPWHVQGQKYQHACYIHPRGPNFRPFRSTTSRFWVMAQFSEKCTEWPQMTLTCSRSKIPTCMLHTWPEAQIFVPFTLRWALFKLRPNYRKSAQNDLNELDMLEVKNTNMHVTYTPEAQILPFRSTISRFWVTGQFSKKYSEWPQMTLTCSRSKIPTCMLHTPPEAQIFVSFALR